MVVVTGGTGFFGSHLIKGLLSNGYQIVLLKRSTSDLWRIDECISEIDLFNVDKDQRGNAKADTEGESSYATSKKKVFAAGDMRRGQSLVVWAIREGRQCARSVDEFLMGSTTLPR